MAKGIKRILIAMALLLALRVIFFKGPVQIPAALPKSPIIDMHIHTAGIGQGGSGCYVSDELLNSYKFGFYLKAFGVTKAELEQQGDQIIVEKLAEIVNQATELDGVVVLALDGVIDEQGKLDKTKTQVYIPNDYVAEQVSKYPKLYFGASINPYRHDAIERLEKAKQQGARLIKWIPNIQHIDPSDEKLMPFYERMKQLDLALLSHTGQEKSFADANDEYGDPVRLKLPLSMGLTVIAAHIATTGRNQGIANYQRILPLFEQYPNLYTDISSLTQFNKLGYINKALQDERLRGRLIYGSDYPLINMALVSPFYFPLNLTMEQMSEIKKIDNPFQRDLKLKQALGVSDDIFRRSGELLNIPPQKSVETQ